MKFGELWKSLVPINHELYEKVVRFPILIVTSYEWVTIFIQISPNSWISTSKKSWKTGANDHYMRGSPQSMGWHWSPILPIEFIKISSFTQHPSSFQLPMRWRINGGSLFYLLIYAIIFQFLLREKSSSKQNAHALFTENYTWSVWFNTHLIATRLACLPVLC